MRRFAFLFLSLLLTSSLCADDSLLSCGKALTHQELSGFMLAPMRCAGEVSDTIRITASEFAVFDYSEFGNDWFVAFDSQDKAYSIRLDYISRQRCGTFTQRDLIGEYSYVKDNASYEFSYIAEAVITVTETDDAGLQLEADLVGSDGRCYKIICQQAHPMSLHSIDLPALSAQKGWRDGRLEIGSAGRRHDVSGRQIR